MFDRFRSVGIAVAVLMVLAMLVTGCGSSDDGGQATEDAPGRNDVELDGDDNGSRVEVEQGEVLAITLESNPSTGFSWEIDELDGSVLQQVGEPLFKLNDAEDPPPPGTGGWTTYRFEAKASGETDLKLIYHQPWEGGEEPISTFAVHVVVR
jgi:inhibitor of cysteine peptidase